MPTAASSPRWHLCGRVGTKVKGKDSLLQLSLSLSLSLSLPCPQYNIEQRRHNCDCITTLDLVAPIDLSTVSPCLSSPGQRRVFCREVPSSMAMALPPQRQNPLPPPPLSMNTPPPMDVTSLVTDNNGIPYPTPASASSVRPSLTLPPTSMPEPEPASTSTMENGRIYRSALSLIGCMNPDAELPTALTSSSNPSEPACVDSETRLVEIHATCVSWTCS